MCGICGKLEFDAKATIQPNLLTKMADAIFHHGPDEDKSSFIVGGEGLRYDSASDRRRGLHR
jgi:asparagine synthetase B (glutamine-hydrolysing)